MLSRGRALQIVEILFSIVESDDIDKYLWVEASTTPYMAVLKIEENQKGNNFRLRFSITEVRNFWKFTNPTTQAAGICYVLVLI